MKMKKFIYVLPAALSFIAIFTIVASASVIGAIPEDNFVSPGEQFTVDIVIDGNPGIFAGIVEVDICGKPVKYVGITPGNLFDVSATDPADVDRTGKLLVLFESGSIDSDVTGDGIIATLTFEATAEGDVSPSLTLGDVVNSAGKSVAGDLTVSATEILSADGRVAFDDGTDITYMSCSGEITLPDSAAPGFIGWKSGDIFLPAGEKVGEIADGTVFEAVKLTLIPVNGASIRLGDRNGLRFLTRIDRAGFDALSKISPVSLGTVIVPDIYAAEAGKIDTGFEKYLDVGANGFYDHTDADFYILAGSVVDILTKNYTLRFAAAGYVEFTYSNGNTARIYSDYLPENSRSVADVAHAAMADISGTYGDEYIYPVDGGYSPYSPEQMDIIVRYLEAAPYSEACYLAPYTFEGTSADDERKRSGTI